MRNNHNRNKNIFHRQIEKQDRGRKKNDRKQIWAKRFNNILLFDDEKKRK